MVPRVTIIVIIVTIVEGLLCAWLFTCLILFSPTKVMKIDIIIFMV